MTDTYYIPFHNLHMRLTTLSQALLKTIQEWPKDIYDISTVIVAVHSELDKSASTSKSASPVTPDSALLMECLAELSVRSPSYLYFSLTFFNQIYRKSPTREGSSVFLAITEAERFRPNPGT
jgi:hypothetical protein